MMWFRRSKTLRCPHSCVLVVLGWSQGVLVKGKQGVGGSPAWAMLKERPGARELVFNQEFGVIKPKGWRCQCWAGKKEPHWHNSDISPQGCIWILWWGWGVSHWRFASGVISSIRILSFPPLSSQEPLTDSSPAGICAVLPVIHHCQGCYGLTAAADGLQRSGGCLRDRRYILLHPSFPLLARACVTSYLIKTGVLSPALWPDFNEAILLFLLYIYWMPGCREETLHKD